MILKHGPWKIQNSKVKYRNKWIEVREDKVLRPDGKPGIFGIVNMVSGVSVLPLDKDGFVYLTNEFKYALGKKTFEVVSGAIDRDEKPIEAAKRELKEELGIEAEDWISLGIVDPFTNVVKSPAHLFLARGLKFSKTEQEGTEKIKPIKVEFEKAVDMVMKSEITHGPSCTLILKANEYLRTKHSSL